MRADAEASARASYAAGQDRRGDWMQSASGGMFWPMDPRVDEITIKDIAHALSNLCRFGGHCKFFYSVAQHSVYVSQHLEMQGYPPEVCFIGLMHDATEAYCVDVPRPIKRFLAGYAAIEARIWRAIADKFDMPAELPECIHEADNAMLLAEKAQIMFEDPEHQLPSWSIPGTASTISIQQWLSPELARAAFLRRFAQVGMSL